MRDHRIAGIAGMRASLVAAFVVALAAPLTAAGCYSPSLRDCTVSCASPGDCAGGQVCGSDGLCAAPEAAGKCQAPVDAGLHLDGGAARGDAGMIDAGMIDAGPTTIPLRIQIDGKGSVTIDGHGSCSSQGAQHGDCTYMVAPHVAETVRVNLLPPGDPFTAWTSMTCKDATLVCTFTPSVATTVVAKFDKAGGGP